MSVASSLLQIKNKISTALSHCNDALALKGAMHANSIWEVGDKINEIPASDDSITKSIIDGSIKELEIPYGINYIRKYGFSNLVSLENVIIPNSVSYIDEHAFDSCISITSVYIPDSVHDIGNGAFMYCRMLNSINIPSAVTRICPHTFYNCRRLSSITIPSAVTNIDDFAFYDCGSLAAVIIQKDSSIISLGAHSSFDYTPIAYGTGYIYVPQVLLSEYQNATNWSTYANQFRALEEYTVDGSITGELDVSKI